MNIRVDDYNICYKITGEGDETVVILQGWGTDLGVYDSVASSINEKYRVVQFDLPGFGGSDEPREAWNVDAFADFFCKFMEALEIKKAILIGHSYGGRVIIKLAARESLPFEIDRIVLIDSAGVLPKACIFPVPGTDRRLAEPSGIGGLPERDADDAELSCHGGERGFNAAFTENQAGDTFNLGRQGYGNTDRGCKDYGRNDSEFRTGSDSWDGAFFLLRATGDI